MSKLIRKNILGLAAIALFAAAGCGDEHADEVHLHWITMPDATLTAGTAVPVSWSAHADGDLHHTEIRACMGEVAECGLGDMSSFDENFAATPEGDNFTASVSLDVAGTWTVVVYAHVDADPHISEAAIVTVQ